MRSRAVIFNMDAIDEHENQAGIFKDCNVVYLHCVDTQNPVQFKITGLPFLSLKSYFCHFSFINSLAERRICVVPNSEKLLQKLEGIKSPCVIRVSTSISFKVMLYLFVTLQFLSICIHQNVAQTP